MYSFYVALVALGLLAVFGDQLTTGVHSAQGVRIANDPGKYERNRLPRYFLRRLGPLKGPLAYYPVELAIVLGVQGGIYYAFSYFVQATWALTLLGSLLLASMASVFVFVIIHNTRGIIRLSHVAGDLRKTL